MIDRTLRGLVRHAGIPPPSSPFRLAGSLLPDGQRLAVCRQRLRRLPHLRQHNGDVVVATGQIGLELGVRGELSRRRTSKTITCLSSSVAVHNQHVGARSGDCPDGTIEDSTMPSGERSSSGGGGLTMSLAADSERGRLGSALVRLQARSQTPSDLVAHKWSLPSTGVRTNAALSRPLSPGSYAGGWPRSEWPVPPGCWWGPRRVL